MSCIQDFKKEERIIMMKILTVDVQEFVDGIDNNPHINTSFSDLNISMNVFCYLSRT